jgi:choline dehydrogenase
VAPKIYAAAMAIAGQACVAIKRLYVHDSIYDAVCDELGRLARETVVGDGLEPGTQMGPIQNRAQFERVKGFLQDARQNGKIVAGGSVPEREGYFVQPTIVRDIADNARGGRATGVEISYDGKTQRIGAGREVVLSLGAINTPKVLMQSGIGDQAELRRFGIPVLQHLPGVGQNLQDHVGFGCVWEYREAQAPRNNMSEASFFWKSNSELPGPDVFTCVAERPWASAENAARFGMPAAGWTLFGGVAQPKSRGRIRLTGPGPLDPVQIEANFLSHPDDLKTAMACVELCRAVGNSAALRPFAKREVMPGNLSGAELENYIRDAAVTYWHQTCTAKMGRDAQSVVDGNLKVYGVENLRIVDGSIMPRVTTGNTMAPCVVIGERAAEILKAKHKL